MKFAMRFKGLGKTDLDDLEPYVVRQIQGQVLEPLIIPGIMFYIFAVYYLMG